jgi:hypothetical protein
VLFGLVVVDDSSEGLLQSRFVLVLGCHSDHVRGLVHDVFLKLLHLRLGSIFNELGLEEVEAVEVDGRAGFVVVVGQSKRNEELELQREFQPF